MTRISNDEEFRKALDALDIGQQRALAARFVQNVLPLSNDGRLTSVVAVARRGDVSAHELGAARKTAMAAVFDGHTRCGSDGDWAAQANYFVARATAAAVAADSSKAGGIAWEAAMSSRLARTSSEIDAAQAGSGEEERQKQYQILSDFLAS